MFSYDNCSPITFCFNVALFKIGKHIICALLEGPFRICLYGSSKSYQAEIGMEKIWQKRLLTDDPYNTPAISVDAIDTCLQPNYFL